MDPSKQYPIEPLQPSNQPVLSDRLIQADQQEPLQGPRDGSASKIVKQETSPSTSPQLTAADLPHWQSILTQRDPRRLQWPITRLCLPGTHDSGTYGPGTFPTNVARFNWHCQSHNFYEQAKLGVRYFDLRLARGTNCSRSSKFWPFHGAARKVGDVFADSPKGLSWKPSQAGIVGWKQTIAGQLLNFVQENPTEVFVIHLTVQDTSKWKNTVWETLLNTLNEAGMCVPSPDGADGKSSIPTIAEVRERRQNFVIIADSKPTGSEDAKANLKENSPEDQAVSAFVKSFIWKMPGTGVLQGPYTSATWKMNSPEVVRKAIEDWMTKNETTVTTFTHFWAAQCQLTPSVNNVFDIIQSLWNPKMTTEPAKLALVMNPFVKNVLMQDPLWKRRVSMVQVDFVEAEIALSIVRVNFDSARA